MIDVGITTKAANTTGTTASTPATGVNTQPSGSAIIVALAWRQTQTFSGLADNKGNTYTLIGSEVLSGSWERSRLYYCENAIGGADHQWTLTLGGSTEKTVLVLEITGGQTSGILDQAARAYDTTEPFASGLTPNTTQANELLVAFCAGGAGNPETWTMDASASPSSGWTERVKEANGNTYWAGTVWTAYVTATGQYGAAFNEANGTEGAVHIATFKEAAGGGGPTNEISVRELRNLKRTFRPRPFAPG